MSDFNEIKTPDMHGRPAEDAPITGLPAGNYKILFGSGNMYDYWDYQSGGTYYVSQTNFMQTEWIDWSFEVW